jgi:hypothetical protein
MLNVGFNWGEVLDRTFGGGTGLVTLENGPDLCEPWGQCASRGVSVRAVRAVGSDLVFRFFMETI